MERSFEHVLDEGGMRRAHLRDGENVAKRYLIHAAAFNLGLIMRKLTGFGTPQGGADARRAVQRRWRVLCEWQWERLLRWQRFSIAPRHPTIAGALRPAAE